MLNAPIWLGSGWGAAAAADAVGAVVVAGAAFGPLGNCAFAAGVMGVAGVGGSCSCAASDTGVAPVLALAFLLAAVCAECVSRCLGDKINCRAYLGLGVLGVLFLRRGLV